MMAFQIGPEPKTGLNVAIAIAADAGAVDFTVVVSFNPHPGCLRLDKSLIKSAVAIGKLPHFEWRIPFPVKQ